MALIQSASNPFGTRRRRSKVRTPRYPLSIERQYVAAARDLVRAQFEIIEQLLLPRLGEIQRLAGIRGDSVRFDQSPWRAVLKSVIQDARQRFEAAFGTAAQDAEDAARSMSLFSRGEIRRQLENIVSVDIFADDPEILDALEQFVEDNVAQIRTTSAANFDTIERIVSNGFRAGQRAETVGKQIVNALGVSESRAAFWARDQLSSLAGQMTQRRQVALGIQEYVWRTSRDERVRESHRQLEGTTQRWDDPPTVGVRQVHPGEDYNCRCTAEPKVPGVKNAETGPADVRRDPELVKRRRERDRRRRERNRRRSLSKPSGIEV